MSTPHTPARRYAKEVRIETRHYEATHGRAPRGYGDWVFAPSYAADERTPSGEPLDPAEAGRQIDQTALRYRGAYAQARTAAAKDAAAIASTRTDASPRQHLTIATLP